LNWIDLLIEQRLLKPGKGEGADKRGQIVRLLYAGQGKRVVEQRCVARNQVPWLGQMVVFGTNGLVVVGFPC
jgi:hypothetical protein